MAKRLVYLDNAATTPVDPKYKDTIDEYLYASYGNAGSPHILGRKARQVIDRAREKIAVSFGCRPDNIVFTSSGSEANSLGILGVANHLRSRNRTHVLCSEYEHSSVLNSMKRLEEYGFDVEVLSVHDHTISPQQLQERIRPETGLVSVMYINNEIGSVNDISALSKVCHESGVLFHSDCVQAAGIRSLDVDSLGVDMLTVSGHKIHAPKGVGCLFVRTPSLLDGLICGGDQEFGLRPGTENVSFIAAFGDALHEACTMWEENLNTTRRLIVAFMGELAAASLARISTFEFKSNSDCCTSKIRSLQFDGVDAETLVLMLSDRGVFVSAGAACSSNHMNPSHVLTAIGLSEAEARSTIRVSFSPSNTIDDVVFAAKKIVECVDILRS